MEFIPRRFNNNKIFDKFIHDYNISVILGETGSGKTYLLKDYYERNKETSKYIELIALDYEEVITENIKIVLLDSIDEALYHNPSDKILKKKISKFILKCREVNENIKFVITCRYSEWKELYEKEFYNLFNHIEDEIIHIYTFDSFNKEDINLIISNKIKEERSDLSDLMGESYLEDIIQEEIDKFWNFIEKNYLYYKLQTYSYTQNLQVLLVLLQKFQKYEEKKLEYYEVYQKVIEEHILVTTDNERSLCLDKNTLSDMLETASCLAFYMNSKSENNIDRIENINKLANEISILVKKDINAEKLKSLFDTALIKNYDNKLRFISFSINNTCQGISIDLPNFCIQNYLTAYFLKENDINVKKTCFDDDNEIIEKYKNVLVYYYTKEKKGEVNKFIKTHPFLFRRHPFLTQEQQEKLLSSIIKKLKSKTLVFDEDIFYDSTLVKFNKIKNIYPLIKDINLEDNEILTKYLMRLFSENYSKEFKNFIFKILLNISQNQLKCRMLISYISSMDNSYNIRLFEFMKENKLFSVENDNRIIEVNLFKALFGKLNIKSLDANLDKMLFLFDYIPNEKFLEVLDCNNISVHINDVEYWFKEKWNSNQYSKKINYILYRLLRDSKLTNNLENILLFIQKNKLSIPNLGFMRREGFQKIPFTQIADEFWKIYFSDAINTFEDIQFITQFFDITKSQIEEGIKKYSDKDNYKSSELLEYVNLVLEKETFEPNEDLIFDDDFDNIIKDIIDREKYNEEIEYRKYIQENDLNKYWLKIYKYALEKSKDMNSIEATFLKLNKKLKEDLKEQYISFIEIVKKYYFDNNELIERKKDILFSCKKYNPFNFLFSTFSLYEIEKNISEKEDKEKFFYWIVLGCISITPNIKNFINNNFDIFLDVVINYIKLSFETYNDEKKKEFILNRYTIDNPYINFKLFNFNDIDKCDSISLEKLINFLVKIEENDFKLFENQFVEIISLDKKQYEFIKNKMITSENPFHYLDYFIKIDINKAVDYFYELYEKKNAILELFNKLECNNYEKLNENNIEKMLKDYYSSLQQSDKFNIFISNIWKLLKEDIEKRELLKKLKESDCEQLSKKASFALSENKELIFNKILKDDKKGASPLIITEGKTDWKHLKKALKRLKNRELNIKFDEYEYTSMSASELENTAKALSIRKLERMYICIFDRDLSDYKNEYNINDSGYLQIIDKELRNRIKDKLIDIFCLKSNGYEDDKEIFGKSVENELKKFCKSSRKKYKSENKDKILKEFHANKSKEYKDIVAQMDKGLYQNVDKKFEKLLTYDIYKEWKEALDGKVYAFCIPSIKDENGKILDDICIEWYYKESEIKEEKYNGKRIFLGNEFENYNKEKRYSPSKCGEYKSLKQNINELDILDSDKGVYRIADIECNQNIALSKNDFAENIVDRLNIDNFKFIFDIIDNIVND